MAAAARRFVDTLDGAQQAAASHAFEDDAARRDWHYIPRPRGGLAFTDMTAVQQKAAYDLLATGTSLSAYAAAAAIMALEDVLDVLEEGRGPRRYKPEGWGRHRADYSTTVFGEPGGPAWGWRFEGHHVSVNTSVVGGTVTVAPVFLGSNPARVPDRPGLAPLLEEDTLACALVAAEPEVVVATDAPDDILTENAARLVELPPEEGRRVADMGAEGRAVSAALVELYLSRLPAPEAAAWRGLVEPTLGDVRVAYAGRPERGAPQYYRVQGPHLLVEYDNTQDRANHIHTVLRDPERDFGDDALRRHRAAHTHDG